jgi:hypothetical protein
MQSSLQRRRTCLYSSQSWAVLTRYQVSPYDPESCTAIQGSLPDSDVSDSDSESDGYDQLAPSSPDPLPGSSPTRTYAPSAPLPPLNADTEHMDTPHTPYRRVVTYAARDRRHIKQDVQVERRRSSRLQALALNAAFCADPDRGVFTPTQLRSDGYAIIPWMNE